jgi:hypothetical protein
VFARVKNSAGTWSTWARLVLRLSNQQLQNLG